MVFPYKFCRKQNNCVNLFTVNFEIDICNCFGICVNTFAVNQSTFSILQILWFPYVIFIILFFYVQVQEGEAAAEETKKSNHVQRKLEKRQQGRTLDPHIEEQFGSGRLLACIASRPGQCGRADG